VLFREHEEFLRTNYGVYVYRYNGTLCMYYSDGKDCMLCHNNDIAKSSVCSLHHDKTQGVLKILVYLYYTTILLFYYTLVPSGLYCFKKQY